MGATECNTVQGYLTDKKMHPPRTLQEDYAQGPVVILGWLAFLMNEVPLQPRHPHCGVALITEFRRVLPYAIPYRGTSLISKRTP